MISINDSVLLMMVGMLNFLGAILLAHARVRDEGLENLNLPPLPAPMPSPAVEIARG